MICFSVLTFLLNLPVGFLLATLLMGIIEKTFKIDIFSLESVFEPLYLTLMVIGLVIGFAEIIFLIVLFSSGLINILNYVIVVGGI